MDTEQILRLRAISSSALELSRGAPAPELSQIRDVAARVSQASDKLVRVLRASSQNGNAVRIARFSTTAETVIEKMNTLCVLYGQDVTPDQVSNAAEDQLREVAKTLVSFAEITMQESIQSISDDLMSAAEQVTTWNVPALSIAPAAVSTHGAGGELALTFMHIPETKKKDVLTEADHKSRTLFTRLFSKRPVDTPKPKEKTLNYDKEVSDDHVDFVMKAFGNNAKSITETVYVPNLDSDSYRDVDYVMRWQHPLLTRYGLGAATQNLRTIVVLGNTPPEVMTNVWEKIAQGICGDPESLRQALHLRHNDDFRDNLRKQIGNALSRMETQIESGSPMPISDINDPVVRSAALCTLRGMSKQPLMSGKTLVRGKWYDPFGIRKQIEALHEKCPGIEISARPDGLALVTKNGYVKPFGVTAHLHTHVSGAKKAFNAYLKTGEPLRLRMNADIDMMRMLTVFTSVYMKPGAIDIDDFTRGHFETETDPETGDLIHTYAPWVPEPQPDEDQTMDMT